MKETVLYQEESPDFFATHKMNRKMAQFIRENLAAEEEPLDFGWFHPWWKYWFFYTGAIAVINLLPLLLKHLFGMDDGSAYTLGFMVGIGMIAYVLIDKLGIVLTNQRLWVIPRLNCERNESIILGSIESMKLDQAALRLRVEGRRINYGVSGFSSMYWKDRRRKNFLAAFHKVK